MLVLGASLCVINRTMAASSGSKLRQAREAQELSIEEISEVLHIRAKYLIALEADNPDAIPSLPQARGFLRTYANYLGLSSDQIFAKRDQTSEKSGPIEQPEPTSESKTSFSSGATIFKEIGEALHQRREILGLSMEDVEAHTKIPAYYVNFIESGEFSRFPSPAQSRGMLHNYTDFLDLDTDAIMAKYADALQASLTERQAVDSELSESNKMVRPKSQGFKVPQWVRMFLSPDLILITTVGILVVGLTIWGIGRVVRTRAEQSPLPTAPSLVEALLPTATSAPTASATAAVGSSGELLEVGETSPEDTQIPTVQIASGSSLQVVLIARQRAYLRVTIDGTVAYDGRTTPTNNLTFTGQEEIRVLTGNAAALQVYFNNQDLGVLGIFGEVAEIVFTRDGVIRPTKAPTETPLATDTPTSTALPTETPGSGNLPPEQNTPVP